MGLLWRLWVYGVDATPGSKGPRLFVTGSFSDVQLIRENVDRPLF